MTGPHSLSECSIPACCLYRTRLPVSIESGCPRRPCPTHAVSVYSVAGQREQLRAIRTKSRPVGSGRVETKAGHANVTAYVNMSQTTSWCLENRRRLMSAVPQCLCARRASLPSQVTRSAAVHTLDNIHFPGTLAGWFGEGKGRFGRFRPLEDHEMKKMGKSGPRAPLWLFARLYGSPARIISTGKPRAQHRGSQTTTFARWTMTTRPVLT